MICVDADACPVVNIVESIAKKHALPVTLFCDTNHILASQYSTVITVGAGRDAVDFALVNRLKKGDIVVTQDYGVAAMSLTKGAKAIHQNGIIYTEYNIESLLNTRYFSAKARRSSSKCHIKGPKKRTALENSKFAEAFEMLCIESKNNCQFDD